MTDTPKYSVIRNYKEIELRQYPAYNEAEVDIPGSTYRQAIFKGFSILADFIFGNNIKSEKIAMTSPVMTTLSEKIAMTKPVTIRGDGSYKVSFIMPSDYSLATLPVPKNDRIRFKAVPPHTMAATRFVGFYNESKVKKAKQRLIRWLEKEGLETQGDFVAAGYNPPWVPWFLARNEVMIRIKGTEG